MLPAVVVASGGGALEELEGPAENEDEERSMARYLDASAADNNDTEVVIVRHLGKRLACKGDNGDGPFIRNLDHALDDDDDHDDDNDDDDVGSFVTTAQQPDGLWRGTSTASSTSGFLPLNQDSVDHGSSSSSSRSLWNKTFFPDDCLAWRGIVWAEGEFAIKLLKFTAFTFGGIVLVFYWVRWMVRANRMPIFRVNDDGSFLCSIAQPIEMGTRYHIASKGRLALRSQFDHYRYRLVFCSGSTVSTARRGSRGVAVLVSGGQLVFELHYRLYALSTCLYLVRNALHVAVDTLGLCLVGNAHCFDRGRVACAIRVAARTARPKEFGNDLLRHISLGSARHVLLFSFSPLVCRSLGGHAPQL
jgi:hypothetical protein